MLGASIARLVSNTVEVVAVNFSQEYRRSLRIAGTAKTDSEAASRTSIRRGKRQEGFIEIEKWGRNNRRQFFAGSHAM
jgi:hypothetical protein